MVVTLERLIAAGLSPTRAREFVEPLARILTQYWVDRPRRIAAFIGQAMVETAGFNALEENLFYSSAARIRQVWPSRFATVDDAAPFARNPKALANRVYANRLGNGPEASGDGWRYRGRGLKQLTGRANYADAERLTGRPYVAQPDLVAQVEDAVLSAAAYFRHCGAAEAADAEDWDRVTRLVNGPAMLQAKERAAASRRALRAFL